MAQVRYIVEDVDKSIRFYCEHLNFDLRQQFGPAMAIVVREGLELWLAGPRASASQPMPDGRKPEPGGWNRIVVSVDNLSDVRAGLVEHGVVFLNDIIEGPGGKQTLCQDPSGNAVELFEPAG